MASRIIVSDNERAQWDWKNMKVQCPICNKVFDYWYCPNCGLPKNNSAYGIYENKIFYCGSNHFRKEFGTVREYQLCSKCYTPNPYHANYCRNCGEDITLQARDINGHGWVDLGLSVLWSTESLPYKFLWNDNTIIHDNHDNEDLVKIKDLYIKSNYGERGKDAATHSWGEKWRTPTKEDFEELITKCKWEKYIIPTTNQFALKGIGPNGNSIIFPMNSHEKSHYASFWSSTQENNTLAYAFRFSEKVEFKSTLTAKQKKRKEFAESNETRFKVELTKDELLSCFIGRDWWSSYKLREEKRRKTFPQYETILEEQRKILDAMGDDSHEIECNKQADLKRWYNLWLTTPIKITLSANPDFDNAKGTLALRLYRKRCDFGIRPVADKKWKGCL